MNQNELKKAHSYITANVSPILEELTTDLIQHKPEKTIAFMIDWLDKNGQKILEESRQQNEKRPIGVETSESENEDQQEMEEFEKLIQKKRSTLKEKRISVSAEVYGLYNPMNQFKPKIVEKDVQTQTLIRNLLANNFLFSQLEEPQMEIIIKAMEIKNFKAGEVVIRQNDDGDQLYVVGSGSLSCTKRFPNNKNEDVFLKNYEPGEYFGELALLYNSPRAASITSLTNSTLYSLDRECFTHIVKDSAMKNRATFEAFLSQVEILKSLDDYERSKLCDCLKVQNFEPGKKVITQGEMGNSFYLIIEGKAEAMKLNPSSKAEEVVYEYREKMYFGELALMKDEPRAASIIAKVD